MSDLKKLYKAAIQAQKRAYAPYSKYHVGAALNASGKVIVGCNVENASYGATICAERSAIFSAVSQGYKNFSSLVVVTSNGATPCALCLQVISEFCGPDFAIGYGTPKKFLGTVKLSQLLAFPFRKSDLKRKSTSTKIHLRS